MDPHNPRIVTSKGIILEEYGPGFYEEAIEQYNKAIDLDPNFVDPVYRKGIVLGRLGNHSQAEIFFDQAISLESNDYMLWFNKGICCHKLKRYDDAIACFKKTLELKPEYIHGWHAKGLVFHDMSMYNEKAVPTVAQNPKESIV